MDTNPTSLIMEVAKQSIEVALKCVATGETLLPFILTDGNPGAIHSIVGESFDEILLIAQEQIDGFGKETNAFAFAYDGFVTVQGSKDDCIYIEAAEVGGDSIFLFGQRYRSKNDSKPIVRVGSLMFLKQGHPKIKF